MCIRCYGLTLAVALLFLPLLSAQIDTPSTTDADRFLTPVVDIVDRREVTARRPLAPPPVREADLLWEKRLWRVIDSREKLNLPFAYPRRPFFQILNEAVQSGTVAAYTDDGMQIRLTPEALSRLTGSLDTVRIIEPDGTERIQVVENLFDVERIKRFRLLEIWYFDSQSSTLRVRIRGIAPLLEEYDEQGNLLLEMPLYWVYYPEVRPVLAREPAYTEGNHAARRSWDDVFESRFFSSYIYRQDNVHDRRLRDYLTGRDLLLEADRIDRALFVFEGYLWSY